MLKKYILFVLIGFFALSVSSYAQNFFAFTHEARVVPDNFLQIESGFIYKQDRFEKDRFGKDKIIRDVSALGTLARYGVMKNVELQLEFDYGNTTTEYAGITTKFSGLRNISPGIKYLMYDGGTKYPMLSLHASVKLPAGSEYYKPIDFEPVLTFIYAQKLGGKGDLGFNLGGRINSATKNLVVHYSGALGMPLFQNVTGFVEAFGDLTENTDNHFFDAGFNAYVSEIVEFDAAVGSDLNPEVKSILVKIGFTLKIQ